MSNHNATPQYMEGRHTRVYRDGLGNYLRGRPQGLMFSKTEGIITDSGSYQPEGQEFKDFIILTDDNRGEISISQERIETRERMVNGRMRSYHVADKIKISTEWSSLPSRMANADPLTVIDPDTGKLATKDFVVHTTDRAAAGAEILSWYNEHVGSFWLFLSYDNPMRFPVTSTIDEEYPWNRQYEYPERIEVFFSSFNYDVVVRGQTVDLWNLKLSLEEA